MNEMPKITIINLKKETFWSATAKEDSSSKTELHIRIIWNIG
jgi:hypothetical protein